MNKRLTSSEQAMKLAQGLLEQFKKMRLDILKNDQSLQYDAQSNTLKKTAVSQHILEDGFMDYQMNSTPQWMGLSALEVARKAILHGDLSHGEQIDALQELSNFSDNYQQVITKELTGGFSEKIVVADHARQFAYELLHDHGVIDSYKAFTNLRNASCMWRLFDKMSVDTTIHFGDEESVQIVSQPWDKSHPDQDSELDFFRSKSASKSSTAQRIIKRVQRSMLESEDPIRLYAGSQERDWYTPNAQKTTYQKDTGERMVCWTNGDMRPLTSSYSESQKTTILYQNLKQLVLNSTGIDCSASSREQLHDFTQSRDVFGRPIHIEPICVLNDLQSYAKDGSHALRFIPDIDQEHKNLTQRDQQIRKLNDEIQGLTGYSDFLIPLNTPLAVQSRKFMTHHELMKPKVGLITQRLLKNYTAMLALDKQSMLQEVGIDLDDFNNQIQAYINNPDSAGFDQLQVHFDSLRQHVIKFHQSDFANQKQVQKVLLSLTCLHDALRHWKTYYRSGKKMIGKNYANEVNNFSASLMTSVSLMSDATMLNVKCKSGKDRTGVMIQQIMCCFDYWTGKKHFPSNGGVPELSDSYDCDKQPALDTMKVILGSGAWPTTVAQDCQCAALKSLGNPIYKDEKPYSGKSITKKTSRVKKYRDQLENFLDVGALSSRQRRFLGRSMLYYHKKRSAYNKDFHKLVMAKFSEQHRNIIKKFNKIYAHVTKNMRKL